MNVKFLFWESLRNLRANRGRSLLTVLGILIGVSSVITLTSLGLGVKAQINSQLSEFGTDEIYVYAGNYSSETYLYAPLTNADMEAVCALEAVKDCTPEIMNRQIGVGENEKSQTVFLLGYNETRYENETQRLHSGRNFTKSEVEDAELVVILDETAVPAFFPADTFESVIGKSLKIGGLKFEVIGVAKKRGNSGVYGFFYITVPYTTITLRYFPESRNSIDTFIARFDSQKITADDIKAEMTALLRQRHSLSGLDSNDFTVQPAKEFIESTDRILTSFILFLAFVAGISLLVGGIGIMNIMLVVVTERTREIGLRKAIGARGSDIRIQFLFESAFLSVFGGIIGVIFGFILTFGLGELIKLSDPDLSSFSPVFSVPILLGVLLFSAAFGLFFGIYPANKASELQPVIALRSE